MRNFAFAAARVAVVASMALAAVPSTATVVTFDELTPDTLIAPTVTSQGYIFTASPEGFSYVWGGSSPNSNGTNNLILGYSPTGAITITKVGGGSFTLRDFDVAISWYSGTTSNTLDLNGSPLAITNVLTNYVVNATGTSVTLSGLPTNDGYWSADNFNFTTGVPEPATWALLILGFGVVGGAMRRRQAVRVTYA